MRAVTLMKSIVKLTPQISLLFSSVFRFFCQDGIYNQTNHTVAIQLRGAEGNDDTTTSSRNPQNTKGHVDDVSPRKSQPRRV